MASMVARTRTLPIAYILTKRKTIKDRIKLLEILKDIMAQYMDVTIIADGEFCSPAFLNQVKEYGFHYIVRTKKNILFNGKRLNLHPISFRSYGVYDFSFGKYTSVEMNTRVTADVSYE